MVIIMENRSQLIIWIAEKKKNKLIVVMAIRG
jgi:hypothetical protein